MNNKKVYNISIDEILDYNFRLLLDGELDSEMIAPVLTLILDNKKYQDKIKKDMELDELLQRLQLNK
tara:strand:+ start:503 stop:703 length:201 start_codon:yes stop_codon:yes gene_type:complete